MGDGFYPLYHISHKWVLSVCVFVYLFVCMYLCVSNEIAQ